MTNYVIKIEAKQGELKSILDELNEAQEKIYECYSRLQNIGVLTISEADETASEN